MQFISIISSVSKRDKEKNIPVLQKKTPMMEIGLKAVF